MSIPDIFWRFKQLLGWALPAAPPTPVGGATLVSVGEGWEQARPGDLALMVVEVPPSWKNLATAVSPPPGWQYVPNEPSPFTLFYHIVTHKAEPLPWIAGWDYVVYIWRGVDPHDPFKPPAPPETVFVRDTLILG